MENAVSLRSSAGGSKVFTARLLCDVGGGDGLKVNLLRFRSLGTHS